MKRFFPYSVLLMFAGVGLAAETPDRAPNVIVIFTDDHGWADAGCYGSKDIETPNIDALAKRGVRFTQFCAAAPVCSPSRAGLLTGRFPPRAGMPGNAPSTLGEPGMPPGEVTIAETLKQAGYATGHIGKWHLGFTPETMPLGQGFDYSFGHMGGCIDNFSHFFYWNGPNRHDLWRNGKAVQMPGRYFPDLMVEEAGQFMEKNKDRPFFIYFAPSVPHYPYQGTPEWLERYKDLPYPRNLYAAFLSTIDERIGHLLERMDALGLREDTIVIFQSDHGYSTEDRAHFGGGSSGPFRGAKFSLFEGGFRVPAIISWPGKLPQGEVRDQLAHGCDWLPTIAELTGAEILNPDIDGKSLLPVIQSADTPSPHDVLHWVHGNSWAVREGDWKIIINPLETGGKKPRAKVESPWLSNLALDQGEQKNFAEEYPDIVRKLTALHQSWVKSIPK
ncbi:sulfatase-like hydrolase/transferase [Haloferula sp.]|uniref:sulfatase-like hydrolase/transferase n=1 Tax=Haloferula sp. TaxID=2497595 RepID=UPI003C76AE21